jgi:hypothetical protein
MQLDAKGFARKEKEGRPEPLRLRPEIPFVMASESGRNVVARL